MGTVGAMALPRPLIEKIRIKITNMGTKQLFESAMLLSLAIATAGCSGDDTGQSIPTAGTHKVVLTGLYGGDAAAKSATRMVYDADSRLFNWQDGDKITVYDEAYPVSDPYTLTLVSGAGTNKGVFEGSVADGVTLKYVTFGVMSLETGTAISNGSPNDDMRRYSSISSAEGDIMAASPLTATGTDTYSFALQHKLAYITNTTTSGSPMATLTFEGTNLAGKITMDYQGNTTVTPYGNGGEKSTQVGMTKFDGTQYIVALPGGTVTKVWGTYASDPLPFPVWGSGTKTLSAGKLLNFKKTIK